MAMEARCYRGGVGRTRMKELHIHAIDYAASGTVILLAGGLCWVKLWGIG